MLEPPAILEELAEELRHWIIWRDTLEHCLKRADAELARKSRAYATAAGDLARPTLPQLRRALFEPGGVDGLGSHSLSPSLEGHSAPPD